MVNTSSEICDKIGHIMNYGDGWYGGVYVAAMYALAFISDDVNYVVEEALKTIPAQSEYAQCMMDVIRWHKEYPNDWKLTWFNVQRKWAQDVGCPDGVFDSFDIDAKINSAWILVGLLYGGKDYGKTVSISARCGDDSDCNPASAGGILGTIVGYKNLPAYWKMGLAEVEPVDFKYTTISLNDVYDMSFRHALEVIKRNGGSVTEKEVTISIQDIKPVKLEIGFQGHYPVLRKRLRLDTSDSASVDFTGIGFAITGRAEKKGEEDYTLQVKVTIDGKVVETTNLPTNYTTRKYTPFWKYQLPRGKHEVVFKILNPSDKAHMIIEDLIVYDSEPSKPAH